jgi:hypothetical protein
MFLDRAIVFDTKTPSDFKGSRPARIETLVGERLLSGTQTIHEQEPGGFNINLFVVQER